MRVAELMAARAPAAASTRGSKALKTGQAETPAPVLGATDKPEEKGAASAAPATPPPAAPPVDQSTGAAGARAPEGSADTSELAPGATEALAAVDGTAGAPAALPSGAAAGVDDSSTVTATGQQGPETEQVAQTEQPPAGDVTVEAGAAPASAAADALQALADQLGGTVGDFGVNIMVGADKQGAIIEAAIRSLVMSGEATSDQGEFMIALHRAACARGIERNALAGEFAGACVRGLDSDVRLRVFPGDNLWRGGRYFTVGETQAFAPTDLTPQQLLSLLNERRFNLEWLEAE